jgi:hypothetical protein
LTKKETNFWKLVNPHESYDEFTRRPTLDETKNRLIKQLSSNYPIRTVGHGEEELLISEEEREANLHIIGQPRQGKSKFIEDQIRKDIDLGNGLMLLDPSDNGDTAKNILRYCAKKGLERVLYIDADLMTRYDKYPVLQPLKPFPYLKSSVDSILESVNALFGVQRQTDTNRIRRNFSALLTLLGSKGLTLHETKYFRRWKPADTLPFLGDDDDSLIVKDGFRTPGMFENYFLTTVGRMDTFRGEPLSLMTAANSGIDFVQMIREGWVILVNLYPSHNLSVTQSRLLGIMLISEISHAADIIFKWEPEGEMKYPFYLYLDEAARFASPQIKNIIDYKGKTGLRLIVAHHGFGQFRHQGQEDVLDAIKSGCRIKAMFNVSSYKDRLEMIEDLGYGGDIHPTLAAYANQNIPKRYMVIKKDKETPVRIKVPDVVPVDISSEELEQYKQQLFSQPWFLSREEIQNQINARSISANIKSTPSGKMDDHKPTRKASISRPVSAKPKKDLQQGKQEPPNPPERKPFKI